MLNYQGGLIGLAAATVGLANDASQHLDVRYVCLENEASQHLDVRYNRFVLLLSSL